MIVQEPVQAAIWHCLNHYAYADAIFLAERLHAEASSEDTESLLGTCYYRAGRIREAYWILKQRMPRLTSYSRFLYAKCAVELNKLSEAEGILGNGSESTIAEFGDQAPFALQLLGHIYSATERRPMAVEVYQKALKLNPFLWDTFSKLCNMGEKVDPNEVFQLSNVENMSTCHGMNTAMTLVNNMENVSNIAINNSVNSLKVTPANATPRLTTPMVSNITPDSVIPIRRMHSVFGGSAPTPFSPSFGILPLESPKLMFTPTLTDSNEQKAIPKIVNSFRAHVDQLKEAVFSPSPRQALTPAPHVRRSSRLFSNGSSYSVKENNKSPNRKFQTPKSPSKKSKQRMSKSNLNKLQTESSDRGRAESVVVQSAITKSNGGEGFLAILRDLGTAYKSLALFDCKMALELFDGIHPKQKRTPWVQSMIALAHYELAEYEAAVRMFANIRINHPMRSEYLDYYGTCLWHLQKEAELSALATELVALNRNIPEAWLVAGNCFSLHKERDTAIKFFKRAVQLSPDKAYAHSLLGHEYAVAEETEKALASFRTAVRLDHRHYVAWFGIATVYAKQERWRSADAYFRRALAVHPSSAVLRCHLGVAQASLGRPDKALATLDKAVASDPHNPLCRFQRATVLLGAGRTHEALQELERLRDSAPRESLVYYLLGKVHNKLGNQHLALMHFSWATDLDPKGATGHIKEAFEPPSAEEPSEPVV